MQQHSESDKSKLRVVFMGTPDFAVPSLKILLDNKIEVVGVITATDKYGGRGRKKLIESAVKKFADSQGLTILQPKNLKSPEFVEQLRSLNADLQIVVAFRMLPEVVWDMPPLGTYNLHASLLPRYRGAAPINWAIISGEETTGLTTFKLKHEIDTGSIAYQVKLPVRRSDSAGTLHDRMMDLGAELVLKTVKNISDHSIILSEQDESLVSKAPKIFHVDGEIDPTKDPFQLYNLIRGLSPYPTAWTMLGDSKLKVFKCLYSFEMHSEPVGSVFTNHKNLLRLMVHKGFIDLVEVQLEGRRKMAIQDLLNGLNITDLATDLQ